MRKRQQLVGLFPPGTLTADQASEALRACGGDLNAAKAALDAALTGGQSSSISDDCGGVDGGCGGAAGKSVTTDTTTTTETVNVRGGNKHEVSSASLPTKREPVVRESLEVPTKKVKNDDSVDDGTAASASAMQSSIARTTQPLPARRPPNHSVAIHNLSDREYCCVWEVEEFKDGYRPDLARALLAKVALTVNPVLRERGWRVKRLMESASSKFLGSCVSNGRGDADGASANIQLNLRAEPNKQCQTFRSFSQILNVMLHEITHISIGLEDIHPPAFYELMGVIKQEHQQYLREGKVAAEPYDYGCKSTTVVAEGGKVSTIQEEAARHFGWNVHGDIVDDQDDMGKDLPCGTKKQKKGGGGRRRFRGGNGKPALQKLGIQAALQTQKRRPLLKGAKMIDKRTKAGRTAVEDLSKLMPQELAARAALKRFGKPPDRDDTYPTVP